MNQRQSSGESTYIIIEFSFYISFDQVGYDYKLKRKKADEKSTAFF
jgi:hypothetical protein